eukprot:551329-Pyramimonas_sp.AAC.1
MGRSAKARRADKSSESTSPSRRTSQSRRSSLTPRRPRRDIERISSSSSPPPRDDRSRSAGAYSDNQPPLWMKDIMGEVRGMNNNIAKLEQSMQQEMITFKNALTIHDQSLHNMNARINAVEQAPTAKIKEAVAAAIDTKLESVQNQLDALKAGSGASSSAGSADMAVDEGARPAFAGGGG